MENNITSPFFPDSGELMKTDKIIKEVEPIFKKYGYSEFGFFVGKFEGKDIRWEARSNSYSDSLADYLRMMADHIDKTLESLEDKE